MHAHEEFSTREGDHVVREVPWFLVPKMLN